MLIACTPKDGGAAQAELVRDYFSTNRVEFSDHGPVEFHPTHGQWIRLLHANEFVIENLLEVRPPDGAAPRSTSSRSTGPRWPRREIWVARRPAYGPGPTGRGRGREGLLHHSEHLRAAALLHRLQAT